MSDEPDVLVIGAGPVGLVTALLLAQRGWTSHVVERHHESYGRPRAVSMDPETSRTMQRLGLVDEVHAGATFTRYYDWLGVDGELLLRFDRSGEAPAGWHPMIFNQPDLEDILERAADADPRIAITRGVEAVDLSEHADGVTVRLGDPRSGSAAGSLSARFLVGTDGASSFTRKWLRTDVEDLGFFYDWLIVDVVPADQERDWGDSSIQLCSPDRPTTVVPGGRGRRRWEFMVMPGENPATISEPEHVCRSSRRGDSTRRTPSSSAGAVYTFQARWAKNWYRGRVAIAGDAAHQMPPFAGQGLNSGVRDAANLAWKLDLALAGRAPFSILDSYTAERAEHIQYAIQFFRRAREGDLRARPGRGEGTRCAHARPRGRPLARAPAAAGRGVHARHRRRRAGRTIVPQFRVTAPGFPEPTRFDDVIGADAAAGTLLVTREPTAIDGRTLERLAAVGGTVVQFGIDVLDAEGSYAAEFDRIGAVAYLARPDGYYFGAAARPEDIAELVTSFSDAVALGIVR